MIIFLKWCEFGDDGQSWFIGIVTRKYERKPVKGTNDEKRVKITQDKKAFPMKNSDEPNSMEKKICYKSNELKHECDGSSGGVRCEERVDQREA